MNDKTELQTEASATEGLSSPHGELERLVIPHEVLDLVRFMCATWAEIDKWAYTTTGDAIMHYPVIQGTSNQIALMRIGEQKHNTKNIPAAIKWLMENAA